MFSQQYIEINVCPPAPLSVFKCGGQMQRKSDSSREAGRCKFDLPDMRILQ